MTDWAAVRLRLATASTGGSSPTVDDVIDQALESLAAPAIDTEAAAETAGLLACLAAARSQSTVRDVAFTLACRTPASSAAAVVDALRAAYAAHHDDAVLGPALLRALVGLGERSPLAQVEAAAALHRIGDADTPFLRIQAAKLVGRLEGLGLLTGGRSLLEHWTDASEPAVEGEARFQLALLDFVLALREADVAALEGQLRVARIGLIRAEASEDMRHDARQLLALVDVLLAYLSFQTDVGDAANRAAILRDAAGTLKATIDDPAVRPWAGLASAREAAIEFRLYGAATGFLRLADAIEQPDEWTNFDEALVAVAAALALASSPPVPTADAGLQVSSTSESVVVTALNAVLPRTGPVMGALLNRAVGRTRFARVIARYEDTHGKDRTADTLHRIYAAIVAEDYGTRERATLVAADTPPGSAAAASALERLAEVEPHLVSDLFTASPGLIADLERVAGRALRRDPAGAAVGPSRALDGLLALAVDAPELYGADARVDAAVRPVLVALRQQRGRSLSGAKWQRVQQTVESLVQIASLLRDIPEPFTLSVGSDGLGQQASEDDLQNYLFERLRRDFHRAVHNEVNSTAGGRVDLALHFPEIHIPIEVKAEFQRVDDEHVRGHYLGQADRYATSDDGVAVLLVLDLRATHARSRPVSGQKPGPQLYSLRESWKVHEVPADRHVDRLWPNVVIVGLVPGNQTRPSGMTSYSARPRGPQRS